jgi:hypothetical protein
MIDSSDKAAAAKAYMLNDMNADHQAELSHYLRHYSHLSRSAAHSARLTDISLDSITITAVNGSTYSIALDPPMTSFSEARERLVKMDQDARSGLGISDIRVDEYRPPRGFDLVVFLLCLFTYFSFTMRPFIQPGSSFFERYIRDNAIAETLFWMQSKVFWPMLAIHSAEAFWFERSRLLKHGVERASQLWWKWMVNNFIEGVGVYKRFDTLVKAKREEKERNKH